MQKMEKPLTKAFKTRNVQAVALIVNSPGGSPAQSNLIMKRMRQLKEQHNVPVYAFVEDVAASGGYYLACGADKIFADENSIIGSIGVVSGSFGLDKWIKRYDVERRVYTAGKRKVTMDPFAPENPQDVEELQHVLDQLHDNFKGVVKEARGHKLDLDAPDLFEGKYWVAADAKKIGLIDDIGDLHTTMRNILGEEPKFIHTNRDSPFGEMFGGGMHAAHGVDAEVFARQAISGAMAAVHEEAAWHSAGVSHRN